MNLCLFKNVVAWTNLGTLYFMKDQIEVNLIVFLMIGIHCLLNHILSVN